MRILHITGEFPPYFKGGLSTYIYEVSKRLWSRGNEIDVLVIKGNNTAYNQENNLPISNEINVIIEDFYAKDISKFNNGIFNISEINKEFNVLEKISNIPNIVHIHDWYGVLWASVIKYTYNIPIIMTSHLPLRSGFTYTGHSIEKKEKMLFEGLGFRIADIVIAPSNFIANLLVNEYNVPNEKIIVIPNGVDTQYFSPGKKKNENEKIILSVSRITEQKGIEYLLELTQYVINKMPNVKFIVVGDGPLLNDLKNTSNSMALSNNLEFLGFITRDRLKEHYRLSDIFITTSIYEPFGLTILEAMASGIPVVAFSVGGIKELVRNDKDGILIPPSRVDLMGDGLIQLLLNSKLKLEYGKNARKRALMFKWEKIIPDLENNYKSAIVRI